MGMCFPGGGTHITRDMCFPAEGTRITRNMCFPGGGTHITRDMCFPGGGTHITRDMCFLGGGTHITNGYVFPYLGPSANSYPLKLQKVFLCIPGNANEFVFTGHHRSPELPLGDSLLLFWSFEKSVDYLHTLMTLFVITVVHSVRLF